MRDYFDQRYSPGNITLVAAGNVDFKGLIRVANDCCGKWPALHAPRKVEPVSPHLEFNCLHKETAAQEYLMQLCPGPDTRDEDRFATRVLCSIFGDDGGSRLYWEFVDTGLAEYAAMGGYEYDQAGILMTFLCGSPDGTESNFERLIELQKDLAANGVTESELELAKAKISSSMILGSERPESRMFAVGSNWLARKEYRTVREVAEQYEKLTLADLNRCAEKFNFAPANSLAIGPLESMSLIESV